MGLKRERHIDAIIDKLTNSLENALTGETFNTEIRRLTKSDLKLIKAREWQFNWKKEIQDDKKEVYKLSVVNNPGIIQGLISIEYKSDHIFMHLVESAKFNKGKEKAYFGVPGNLIAFTCKLSWEKGFDGFVAFDSKTALMEHYQRTLGATHLGGQRMYINDVAARKLISKYFKQ